MEEKLIAFITEEFLTDASMTITPDTKLISSGLIDSFSLVELSMFLEETFDVRPDDTELNAENMDTVEMIAAYVDSHRK